MGVGPRSRVKSDQSSGARWGTCTLGGLAERPDALSVLAGTLVPTIRLDPKYIGILVALLGTTISPYLFFWQASQEVEEQISIGRRHLKQRQGASRSELKYALWDTAAGPQG